MVAPSEKHEIRITGMGGQGVILCGYILGKAAALYDKGLSSTMTQSFGPEARGSACSAQVVIASHKIGYPYVNKPGVLIAMSHDSYGKYIDGVAGDALILYDSDLVHPGPIKEGQTAYGIPATRIAEDMGRKIVLNIVMIGFFTAVSDILSQKAVRHAVASTVPKGTEEFNVRAFNEGFQYGKSLMREIEKKKKNNGLGR